MRVDNSVPLEIDTILRVIEFLGQILFARRNRSIAYGRVSRRKEVDSGTGSGIIEFARGRLHAYGDGCLSDYVAFVEGLGHVVQGNPSLFFTVKYGPGDRVASAIAREQAEVQIDA